LADKTIENHNNFGVLEVNQRRDLIGFDRRHFWSLEKGKIYLCFLGLSFVSNEHQ